MNKNQQIGPDNRSCRQKVKRRLGAKAIKFLFCALSVATGSGWAGQLQNDVVRVVFPDLDAEQKSLISPQFDSEMKGVFDTVTHVHQMVETALGERLAWLGGSHLEVYPLTPPISMTRKYVLNAWCSLDLEDVDQDKNVSETQLRFEWDSHVHDAEGSDYAVMKDRQVVAHETGHAILWALFGVPSDDLQRFSFLNGQQWIELRAIDEANGDITALLSELRNPEEVARLELETRGGYSESNSVSRTHEYSLSYLREVIRQDHSLEVPKFRTLIGFIQTLLYQKSDRPMWEEQLRASLKRHQIAQTTGVKEPDLFRFLTSLGELGLATYEASGSDLNEVDDFERVFEHTQAKWSWGKQTDAKIAEKLRPFSDLLGELYLEMGEVWLEKFPKKTQAIVTELHEAKLNQKTTYHQARGLGRDLAKVIKYRPVDYTTEEGNSHYFSQTLSGAIYQALMGVVEQSRSNGLSFTQAVEDARIRIAKVYYKGLKQFADSLAGPPRRAQSQRTYSMKEFAEIQIEQARAMDPALVPNLLKAFSDRGIEVSSD